MEEQDPEEIPMDQVLAEIRHMLSDDNLLKKKIYPEQQENIIEPAQEIQPHIQPPKIMAESVQPERAVPPKEDYFLLTPAMRCDLPSDSHLSVAVQQKAARVINKLQQKNTQQSLAPEVEAWLNNNLPQMVERVLTEKLSEYHK